MGWAGAGWMRGVNGWQSVVGWCGLWLLTGWILVSAVGETAEPGTCWPQWRGPDGTGASAAKQVPTKWNLKKDVLWQVSLPGSSAATPALWEDRLFVLSPVESDIFLFCFSTAGQELWRQRLGSGNRRLGFNSKNNFASSSPMTDGQAVWAMAGSGDLVCCDAPSADGRVLWRRNLFADYGPIQTDFGLGNTPLLLPDRLIFACIHQKAESYVLALDPQTGEELWKTPRPTTAQAESQDAYSSPVLYTYPDGRREIILCAADWVTAYDAETGKEVWRHGDINPNNNPTLRIIATPVITSDFIFAVSAKEGPLYAIRPGGQGDVTKTHRVWTRSGPNARTPDACSPALADGLLYTLHKSGFVSCIEAHTGQEHWVERVGQGKLFLSSPVVADGKVFVCGENGDVFVLEAGPKFKLLATNTLNSYIAASPVPAPGRLYFRTEAGLLCIGKSTP